jgi:hypothetical protein
MTTEMAEGDDDKKPSAVWRKAVKKDGIAGAQSTLLKNAMAINPALKANKNTEELINEVQEARRGHAPEHAAEEEAPISHTPPSTRNKAAAIVVAEVKEWLEGTEARIAAAKIRLKEDKQALDAERNARDEALRRDIVALLRETDPQLDSPMTKAVLTAHAALLRGIGLDERELEKRVRG